MKKYILLRLKQLLKVLPLALLAAVVLFGALGAVYNGVLHSAASSQDSKPFQVALVGTGDDTFLQMGITALESMDASRFALQVVQMEEEDAHRALEQGHIAAYVVFPEGFIENAMYGNILPLRFVSRAEEAGIVSILRIELTRVITDLLDAAQKGTFGSALAMMELGGIRDPWPISQQLALSYTQLILIRDEVYHAEALGISDGLDLSGYLLCGLSVLLLCLCTLCFAPAMIRRDTALYRLLAAKNTGGAKQVLCEQLLYFAGFFLTMVLLLTLALAAFQASGSLAVSGIIALLPVCFGVTALSFFMYEVSGDMLSGVLLQFLILVFLCFVSGCCYPAYFFPESVQSLGSLLPTGLARSCLAGTLTGADCLKPALGLVAWGVGCTVASCLVRCHKLKSGEVSL